MLQVLFYKIMPTFSYRIEHPITYNMLWTKQSIENRIINNYKAMFYSHNGDVDLIYKLIIETCILRYLYKSCT